MSFGGLLGGENHRLQRSERFRHPNEVVFQQLEEEEEERELDEEHPVRRRGEGGGVKIKTRLGILCER